MVYPCKLHLGANGHPRCHFILHIQAARDALQARIDGYALLFEVAQRGVVFYFLLSTRCRELIVLVAAIMEQVIVPVDIATPGNGCILVDVGVGIRPRFALGHVSVQSLFGIGTSLIGQGIIAQAFMDEVSALLTAHNLAVGHGEIGESPVRLEREHGLSAASLLCGDDHNAIGCARAIERGGRGIFDNGDALNVGCVQGRHHVESGVATRRADVARQNGHAIDHIERRVGGVERSHASYADGFRSARDA